MQAIIFIILLIHKNIICVIFHHLINNYVNDYPNWLKEKVSSLIGFEKHYSVLVK